MTMYIGSFFRLERKQFVNFVVDSCQMIYTKRIPALLKLLKRRLKTKYMIRVCSD